MRKVAALIVRMASENPTWGYSRIQGALKNLDHRVARSYDRAGAKKGRASRRYRTRPTSWRTFLRAHWGKVAAADFFTTEVWRARGLVTYYTLFVLDLRTRRVHGAGSTPHPDDAFMAQAARDLTAAVDGVLRGYRALICDRDTKWTEGFRRLIEGAGVRIVQTPMQAPNANACAERFVRSVREECSGSAVCATFSGNMWLTRRRRRSFSDTTGFVNPPVFSQPVYALYDLRRRCLQALRPRPNKPENRITAVDGSGTAGVGAGADPAR
jgi:putative transposase